jgi:hypothetical protein
MKIRLLQLDGSMPNIALMKLSTYHKSLNDDVNWYSHIEDYSDTDILYISKLFNFTLDTQYLPLTAKIVKGGTGYDIKSKLPLEVERITTLDYSLYTKYEITEEFDEDGILIVKEVPLNYSLQFYSRGCTRKCAFCVVPQKEGMIHATNKYDLNPNGKYIEVLDNNFFANPKWEDSVKDLIEINQPVHFHGVQLETITEQKSKYINQLKLHKTIKIAWDDPKYDPRERIKKIIQWVKPYKFMCYVLIGFNSTPKEDLYRVEELRKLKIDPFAMPYNKKDTYQKKFARWVNHKAIFKTVKWEDYK